MPFPGPEVVPQFFTRETYLNASGGFLLQFAPFSDCQVSQIDIRDVAAVAVKVVTEDGHAGKIIP